MKKFIDIHCHYDDPRFDTDRDELISSLPSKNVLYANNAGSTVEESQFCLEMAEKYEHMYFCAGIHAINADTYSDENLEKLKEMWKHEKCVGAGEIGLDNYWKENPPKEIQRNAFIMQALAAKEADIPVEIHCRDAIGDMLEILKSEDISCGVMHCFSESKESAKQCLDRGLYFSFGGTCTFKNSVKAQENLLYIPKDRILLETDCPYLAPVPNRGKRNDSSNIIYVVEHIAMLWNMTPDEVVDITNENAKRLFRKLK